MAAVEEPENGFSHENNENLASTVPERLAKRHQSRLEEAERRREAKESHKLEQEQSEYFNSEFNRERGAVEALLSAVCPGADRAVAAETLEKATARTARLQKFVNDSMLFLTQYELRQAQAALQRLQAALSDAREEALPKKKFAFKARSKATEKTKTIISPSPQQQQTPKTDLTTTDGVDGKVEVEQCGFSHLINATVSKSAAEIERRDVLLSHLRNCRVRLLGSPSTLHLSHIEGCEVLCGPVSSSVFLDHCSDSVLALACQQLRTHNTRDTRVYLHVTSRAIIEDCSGVSFAPFSWTYPGLEQDFQVSGLDRDRNNWREVDDFNWLSAETPSPNWTVISEEERRVDWGD